MTKLLAALAAFELIFPLRFDPEIIALAKIPKLIFFSIKLLSERIFYETYMLESFYTSTSLTHTVQESILDGKAGQYRI